VPQRGVVGTDARANVLWIDLLRCRREADEIAEENRHDLPLLARRCPLGEQRSAATVAEPRRIRVLRAATRADHRPSLEHVPAGERRRRRGLPPLSKAFRSERSTALPFLSAGRHDRMIAVVLDRQLDLAASI